MMVDESKVFGTVYKDDTHLYGKTVDDTSPQTENEQHRFLTGWIPVVKIFTTKNRAVRMLWLLFTVCMVFVLISSISVVVHRYLTYVTVVRLDQRGPLEFIPPPAVTVCLAEHQTTYLQVIHKKQSTNNWNILPGMQQRCDKNYNIRWDSERHAVSPIYSQGSHFRVTLRTDPVICYSLSVSEQIPKPPSSLCTTFELTPLEPQTSAFWKLFSVTIELTNPNRTFVGRPFIVVHERHSFPLDNFGRYLYNYVKPGARLNLFYSKSITKRLNTRGKPCSSRSVRLLGRDFDYDQVACQWHTVCLHYHTKCGCLCPLEVVHRHFVQENLSSSFSFYTQSSSKLLRHCPVKCHHNYPIALVNSSACPLACETVTYKKLNEVWDKSGNQGSVGITFIQAEGLTEMTEEELYSLPKLFSEIGGLSSFFFGFSCILFFELFELAFWLRCTYKKHPNERENARLKKNTDNRSYGGFTLHSISAGLARPPWLRKHVRVTPGSSVKYSSEITKILYCHSSAFQRNASLLGRLQHLQHKNVTLNPLLACQVDGARLSEYPQDRDSPIQGLRLRKPVKQPILSGIACSSNEDSFKCDLAAPHSFVAPLEIRNEIFMVPVKIAPSHESA